VDGRVLSVPVVSERPVLPGATLATIGAPGDLEIVADLLSSDAVRLAPGAPAIVERWGGPEPLEARLVRIEPSARTKVSALGIEEQRVDAVFEIVSPPEAPQGLGDGFSVFLRIVEWQTDDAVQVPLSALWRSGEDMGRLRGGGRAGGAPRPWRSAGATRARRRCSRASRPARR
jgi:HlyD family secretion protein